MNYNVEYIVNCINNNGYYILKEYINTDKCKILYNNIINNSNNYNIAEGGDKRYSYYTHDLALEFLNDKFILEIGTKVLGHQVDKIQKRCQAAILTYNNKLISTSGSPSWHVDNLKPQFKAILYLTNVSYNNGPFAIITPPIRMDDIDSSLICNNNTRIIDQPECKLFTDIYKDNIKIITGNIGDVILVNTNYIHRGTVIKEGERISLTNYYYD